MIRPLLALLALALSCTACSQRALATAPPSAKSARAPIGTNLAPVRDWSTQQPFADLFKQSRAWISSSDAQWDDGRAVDVDARGWVRSLKPGQRARSLVIWGEAAQQPLLAREYVVTWEGTGTLDFWPQRADVDAENRRAVIRAPDASKGGIAVTVTSTDPRDYVRNIRVYAAGNEGKRFNPKFIQALRAARYSTLRFMDWHETNDAKVVTWSERAVVDDARWSTKGVPLEVMVELCNEIGADMWLTIPDTWDDAAVVQSAMLLKSSLAPSAQLYVEHSNEVWNDIFPQAKRARADGRSRKLARNALEAQLRAHAERSVAVFRIFTRVFGTDAAGARVVRVLGSMHASPWATEVMLDVKDAAKLADAVAVAPYFGHEARGDLDSVFKQLERDVAEGARLVEKHRELALAAGVKRVIAYEGGQHLVAADDARQSAVYDAANRDLRMKAVYWRALHAWRTASGGELYVHYLDVAAPSKFGRWGARENLEQPRSSAPKLDALVAFVETTLAAAPPSPPARGQLAQEVSP